MTDWLLACLAALPVLFATASAGGRPWPATRSQRRFRHPVLLAKKAGIQWVANRRVYFNYALEEAVAAPFDEKLMAAMNRPWPDIVFSPPTVAASGMTPSNRITP